MTKNGKYFLRPERNDRDFKELFKHLASAGAGRPVDCDGFPEGPWTPDLLAAAITQIDPSGAGVELRTVQLWFQDNEKGISSENIRWLARIFGCNDPEATSEWQAELSAARSSLLAKRREKRNAKESNAPEVPDLAQPVHADGTSVPQSDRARDDANRRNQRFSLARTSESLFGGSPLNLPSSVFAGAVALGFSSYFLGIHQATFDSLDGHIKEVGFIWAPNWTFLFMVFMPLFFAIVAELLVFWKYEGRLHLVAHPDRMDSSDTWARNVEASSCTFWAVFLICFLFAGVFQWIGVRLLPLVQGAGSIAPDWGSLALVQPEVISVPEEIVFTGFAYFYMCVCFYVFFAGLILLYTVVQDFEKILAGSDDKQKAEHQHEANTVGARVMRGIFRCTVLGIFIAICMKLQSTYLASSGTNIVRWLVGDMTSIFNTGDEIHSLTDYSAPNHFSSLLIVLATVFVFLYGASRLGASGQFHVLMGMMVTTVAILVTSYLLIGVFAGFSILLSVAVLIAIYGLFDPGFETWNAVEQRDSQSVS